MTTNEYRVTGMTCSSCERSIRNEVGEIAGVEDLQVSARIGKLTVTGAATDADVLAAVKVAGYSAVKVL